MPKMIATNTAWEYWRGDAALNHLDPISGQDRKIGGDHRLYALAGIDHMGDSPMKAQMHLANPTNPLGYQLLVRAAFENLVAWVVEGTEPPENCVPAIGEQNAATRDQALEVIAKFPATVLADPKLLPVTRPADFGAEIDAGVMAWPPREGDPLTCYVAAVDDDGNETAGIRLPEVAVPVATYTGWNSPDTGPNGEHALKEFAGSRLPFSRTAAERKASNDPRRSIEERYASREEYERRAREATAQLVAGRFLLANDEERAVAAALFAYDAAVSG
jgi:hypothetical protein